MSVVWKNPKNELPTDGEIVWVMIQHWKKHTPMSLEIYCGETEFSIDRSTCTVNTNDMTGKGSWSVYLTRSFAESTEQGIAWCNAKALPIPSFIETDPHWES
jgi:hypothetical protein